MKTNVRITKRSWLGIFGVFLLLGALGLGLAPAAVLAQTPGPLDHVVVAPATATLAVGATQQFAAQGYDIANVPIPSLQYYWVVVNSAAGTVTQAGLFTAGTIAGPYPSAVEVIAIQGSIVKYAYASVTVTGVTATLDHVTITPPSATLAVGATQQFAAQGYDAANVPIPSLQYFWSVVVAGAGTITSAGLFTAGTVPNLYANAVQVAAVQGNVVVKYATVSVTITGAAPVQLDHVSITPASPTVAAGANRQFSAQGYDAANVAIPGLNYFWSVVNAAAGSINQSGLFTAGNVAGPYPNAVQVIAVQGSIVKYATASVTVNGPAATGQLDHVTISPSSATLAVGATKQFTAQGFDAANRRIAGLNYFWSVVVAGAGTITQEGLFTAGSVPNPYPNAIQVIAVQSGTVKFDTASVTVTVAPPPTTQAPGRLILLLAATLRGVAFDDFLGAQWTEKANGTTYVIKAVPGVVKAISSTSLALLPNGQPQNVTFALATDTVILARDGLKVDERAVVITVNDQARMVLEIPMTISVQQGPPGIKKDLEKYLDKFADRLLPPGWDRGNKTGWDRDDKDDNDNDD